MKSALNYLKNNALLIGGFIILLIALIEYLKGLLPDSDAPIKPKSEDSEVNNAIDVIDSAFDKFGTFNKDHEPIFEVLNNLNKSKLQRLHKDFGTRLYNPVTRTYKLVSTFGWRGYTQRKGLNALFDSEYDESQIKQLKEIYESKGLIFPYL